MQTLIGKVLPRLLGKRPVKILVGMSCLAYWAAAAYGLCQMNEGLQRQNLALKHSHSAAFYNKEDQLFRRNPYRFQIIVHR